MWLLKEDNYSVVQDTLFEKQEQEEQRQRLMVKDEPNKVSSLPMFIFFLSISRVLLLFMISFHVSSIN